MRLVCGLGDRICRGLLFLRRHLRRTELDGQLVDAPGELKRQLVALVHARAGVQANVEGFVNGHEQRNRVRDRLLGHLLPIHCEYASATLAWTGAVVFEVEYQRVLARRERLTEYVAR